MLKIYMRCLQPLPPPRTLYRPGSRRPPLSVSQPPDSNVQHSSLSCGSTQPDTLLESVYGSTGAYDADEGVMGLTPREGDRRILGEVDN